MDREKNKVSARVRRNDNRNKLGPVPRSLLLKSQLDKKKLRLAKLS